MRASLLLHVARPGATLLLGLFAGGVLFTVLAPSLRRLPGPAYVRYWQALNVDYGRSMPVLLLSCLALLLVTCVLSYRRGLLVGGLSVAALLLVTATIVLTLTRLEPLNQLATSWDADQLPIGWVDVREQWWTLHKIRTVLAVMALSALLAAHAVDRGYAEKSSATTQPQPGRLPRTEAPHRA